MKRSILIVFTLLMFMVGLTQSQSTAVSCGMIIEDEFSEDAQLNEYVISLAAGDNLTVSGSPFGEQLQFVVGVDGPTGMSIVVSEDDRGRSGLVSQNPAISTGVLSANGDYTLKVLNTQLNSNGSVGTQPWDFGGVGIYTLFVSCTLRDGTVIEPGDTPPDASPTSVAQVPVFSGFGFPGLKPIDFSNVISLPLIVDVPMTGAMTPAGGEILGFLFEANAADILQLDFVRLSGNLNLGLIVLSANNEVVFQSSLVTSETLSTRLTLPSGGQYTIGVFRIDLLPPANPEATAFQITGSLNP